jgi:UDP-N-acetylglucosamine diphosphorylase/glucosamine-1-phosphate N-acetyltransferase
MSFLLVETCEYKNFYPITATKFLWDISCGIFTPLERFERQFHSIKLYSPRLENPPFSYLKEQLKDRVYKPDDTIHTIINSQFIPFENLSPQINRLGITKEGKFVYLRGENIDYGIVELIINNEIEHLTGKFKVKEIENGVYLNSFVDVIVKSPSIIEYEIYLIKNDGNFISPGNNIYIDKTAKIQQFVSLQAESGPVVIDKGALIRSFTIIDGPSYIGKNTLVDSAKIRSGTTIKHSCKIGGELEASIVESYTNKHHEGFLGHSYAGSWVNIGAIATSSDLKNNYGKVKLNLNGEIINTDTIKFGSVICDFSKIGIGVMLNTGTIIREGANVVFNGKAIPKYIPPFYWNEELLYDIDRFINDLSTMMKKRNVEMTPEFENFLREVYKKETK